MEHSRISYVLLTRLYPYALSVRDIIWKICNFKRPCKARVEVDDHFLQPGCVTNDERDKLTITSETQNPLVLLQNSDVWITLCQFIKKFYTCFVVSFVHKKRGDGNAKERWKIPSEDACKGVLVQGNCQEMQKLALFLLCRFSDYVIQPLLGLFHFGKKCRDVWIWY